MPSSFARACTVLAAALVLALLPGPPAQAQTGDVRGCLDGAYPPSEVIAVYRLPPYTFTLRCGSPISYGILHIDEGHPILDPAAFLRCMDKIAYNGYPGGVGSNPDYLVSKHTVWLGSVDAVWLYEADGNIVTAYTTGNGGSANWGACANS